jgi:DNA-binding response OmpR family regulator
MSSGATSADDLGEITVLVYSDDRQVREDVIRTIGTRPAQDLPRLDFLEVATEPAVYHYLGKRKDIALVILDAEATPAGGMGIARQMKDEIHNAPPSLLLLARPVDMWLATWSRADAAVSQPVEPSALVDTVATLLRRSAAVSA